MPSQKRKPIPVKLNQTPNSSKRPPLPVNLPPINNNSAGKRAPLPVTLPTKPVKPTSSTGQWLRPHSPVYLSLLDTLP